MAKPQLPRSIHDLAIRTVDRIKDRAAVIGIAFFLLGILGSIKSDWCLLAALVFYGIWAVVRIGVLRLDVQAKTAVASNRLAAAIEDATGKIAAQPAGIGEGTTYDPGRKRERSHTSERPIGGRHKWVSMKQFFMNKSLVEVSKFVTT